MEEAANDRRQEVESKALPDFASVLAGYGAWLARERLGIDERIKKVPVRGRSRACEGRQSGKRHAYPNGRNLKL